jgi:hypothetical protein
VQCLALLPCFAVYLPAHMMYPRFSHVFQDGVLRTMIRMSPDEEVAVGRLLSLGHAMWKVEDYKLLHYAVKRFRKEAKRARSPEAKPPGFSLVDRPHRAKKTGAVVRNAAGSSPSVLRKHSEVSFGDVLEDKRFANR